MINTFVFLKVITTTCSSLFRASEAVAQRCSIKRWSQACSFIKKETLAQVFSCKFREISNNTFFTEQLRWLLLALHILKHNNLSLHHPQILCIANHFISRVKNFSIAPCVSILWEYPLSLM